MKPPERKKRKKTTKNSSTPSPPPSSSPSFSLIPDEIAVNCLARISRSYYPRLSIVSKSFRSLLSSTELYAARSHLGSTEQCIYVCLWDRSYQSPQWFTLWINPNKTLPDSITKKRIQKKKKTPGQLLVPVPSSNIHSMSRSSFVVGSEIYVIGGPLIDYEPSSAVQVLNCRSNTWRDVSSMSVARKDPYTCGYDGKIYVLGGIGVEDKPWAEVFDIKTQTWEDLPVPNTEVHKCRYLHEVAEIQGKIRIRYYSENSIKSYDYDPMQGIWESSKVPVMFPESECVIDGVSYRRGSMSVGDLDLDWSTGIYCKRVNGLDSLRDHYRRNGGGSSANNTTKLVSCGGKLYLIWLGYRNYQPNNRKKIWCAEIAVEKRDEGEVWGNVEWVDVVHRVPMSCELLHCLVVSV